MTSQACLCIVSTTVPPPPAANPCQSGCDYCNVGHNGAWSLDKSGVASCPASYHGTPGFQVCGIFAGNGGPNATQPRPRAPMQASTAPTMRPVPWAPSPSPATLRWSCGAWKWSRRARPPPTLAEVVVVVAMLVLGPIGIGRGGCAVPPAQTNALEELYNSTNGPSWLDSRGWMAGDPCTGGWYGVTCNPDLDGVVYVATRGT